MKKTLIIIVIILVILLALPVINLIRWTAQPKKPMDIILVDKTVPTLERENHRSISWILTNGRFVDKEKKSTYSLTRDYYGFVPLKPMRDKKFGRNDYRLTDVPSLAEENDAIYIADTYGVYTNDWYRGFSRTRRSRKLYGGLNNNDYLLVKEMKDRNRLIILEYNSFDYPASAFDSYRTQERLGVRFSGWTGRYFSSLDSTSQDFPIWLTQMYRREHKQPWTFKNPGIIIVNQKNVIVLEEGTHLDNPMPYIVCDNGTCEKYGVASSVAFDKWFDIIDPVECNVLASYQLHTTAAGDTLLSNYSLSNRFPAVTQDGVSPNVYYFAGDFAYNDKPYWTSMFMGVDRLKGIIYSEKPDDPRRFFWLFYKPLVSTIFNDYYASLNNK